jgi:hypothetical protein
MGFREESSSILFVGEDHDEWQRLAERGQKESDGVLRAGERQRRVAVKYTTVSQNAVSSEG